MSRTLSTRSVCPPFDSKHLSNSTILPSPLRYAPGPIDRHWNTTVPDPGRRSKSNPGGQTPEGEVGGPGVRIGRRVGQEEWVRCWLKVLTSWSLEGWGSPREFFSFKQRVSETPIGGSVRECVGGTWMRGIDGHGYRRNLEQSQVLASTTLQVKSSPNPTLGRSSWTVLRCTHRPPLREHHPCRPRCQDPTLIEPRVTPTWTQPSFDPSLYPRLFTCPRRVYPETPDPHPHPELT